MNLSEMIFKGIKKNNATAIKVVKLILDRTTIRTMTDEEAQLIADLRKEMKN